MPYIGKSPSAGVRQRYQYTATAGQTTFSGTDLGNLTLTYTDNNFVDVFQNGVLLKGGGTDYTATSGTSVVLATGASVSDVIEIIVYDVFSVGNFFNRTDSDSRYVNHNSNTAGTDNFIAGNNAGDAIASGGNYNTVVGNEAGTAITTGDNNTAVGFEALSTEDANSNNTAVGYRALKTLNAGSDAYNTAVGADAGTSITTGLYNNIIGGLAGDAITTGDENIAIGVNALTAETAGNKSIAIGGGSLAAQNSTSDTDMHNTAIGYHAGGALTTGTSNVLIGGLAGDALTVAYYNIAIGEGALTADVLGSRSVAIGWNALNDQSFSSTTETYNTAVGFEAGAKVTTGTENTLIGGLAGDAITTGQGNTAVGSQALSEQAGDFNTAIGRQACNGVTSSGNRNTGIAEVALFSVNSGAKNVGIGNAAGYAITSGGNNICLGVDSGRTGSPGGNITTGSNEIALGDENISSFSCQVSLTATSDERDKTDFKDLDLGLDFVNALKPVTYVWDKRANYIDKTDVTTYDEDGKVKHKGWDLTTDLDKITSDGSKKDDDLQVGFKAQDVIALEEAAGYKLSDKTNLTATVTKDGKQYGLSYERFVPMLVKAVQELSAKNDALEARIKKLEDG